MEKFVIIVAGGKGSRLGHDIPKQFLPIHGKPILMHTIERFYAYDKDIRIVVVLPKEHFGYWDLLCSEYEFSIAHKTVEGGRERFFSVKNALELIPQNDALVAVHDAVRPFVSKEVIKKAFTEALEKHVVAPAVKPSESVRLLKNDEENTSFDRNNVYLIQTPQCFYSNILKKAYSVEYSPHFTDDLTVVENVLNIPISLFEGNRENIKITTPFDMSLAEILFDFEG